MILSAWYLISSRQNVGSAFGIFEPIKMSVFETEYSDEFKREFGLK
jgi:hypothetical protein